MYSKKKSKEEAKNNALQNSLIRINQELIQMRQPTVAAITSPTSTTVDLKELQRKQLAAELKKLAPKEAIYELNYAQELDFIDIKSRIEVKGIYLKVADLVKIIFDMEEAAEKVQKTALDNVEETRKNQYVAELFDIFDRNITQINASKRGAIKKKELDESFDTLYNKIYNNIKQYTFIEYLRNKLDIGDEFNNLLLSDEVSDEELNNFINANKAVAEGIAKEYLQKFPEINGTQDVVKNGLARGKKAAQKKTTAAKVVDNKKNNKRYFRSSKNNKEIYTRRTSKFNGKSDFRRVKYG